MQKIPENSDLFKKLELAISDLKIEPDDNSYVESLYTEKEVDGVLYDLQVKRMVGHSHVILLSAKTIDPE